MNEKNKRYLKVLIRWLFYLSVVGFIFLILSDRQYGGGPVIFVFSVWGIIEYIKWINKAFKQ